MLQIDMPLPESCEECRFAIEGWCRAIYADVWQPSELSYLTRPEWCPLQEVQDGTD